jgi:hypothetical protein
LPTDNINIQGNMEKEGAKKMKEDFKKRTEQEATYFEVWRP